MKLLSSRDLRICSPIVVVAVAAIVLGLTPGLARAGLNRAGWSSGTLEFLYKGSAGQKCWGCTLFTGALSNNTNYVNDAGTFAVFYEWTLAGEEPIEINSKGDVREFGRLHKEIFHGSGHINEEQDWNCVDLEVAVYGQPPSTQCNVGPPVEDYTARPYEPWVKSATGGLPKFRSLGGGILAAQFVAPINAAAVEDTGVYANTPGVANSAFDWQFPVWGQSTTGLQCEFDFKKLLPEWRELNRPLIFWKLSEGDTVHRNIGIHIPDQTLKPGNCPVNPTNVWVGDPAHDEMNINTDITVSVKR